MICLTDPAADEAHVPSLTRAPDPRAIGRLIFAVVTGRAHSSARWPLDFDADWIALGASGREWFELCQSLIHPLGEASPDLDELMTQIVSIRPSWRRVRRAVRVAALVACVGLAAALRREPAGPVGRRGRPPDPRVGAAHAGDAAAALPAGVAGPGRARAGLDIGRELPSPFLTGAGLRRLPAVRIVRHRPWSHC